MRYVMDGSPWSFISPFLDLCDTLNMRTTATSWNFAARYTCGALPFFLFQNEPGHCVGGNVQEDGWILYGDANDKVCDLNQQASKYLETLALLHSNFKQICTEKKEVEEQFDRDIHARIEEDLNEGLRVVRTQFHVTAASTLVLTCGKNDRDHSEVHYMQELGENFV